MLDIAFIREHPEVVRKGISAKRAQQGLIDSFLSLDEQWRALTAKIDNLRAQQKKASDMRDIETGKALKETLKALEEELHGVDAERHAVLETIPNLPLSDVPEGNNEADNVVLREVGKKPVFSFTPKDYLTIAQALDLIDIERAAKVSGTRFGYLKNAAARLEFALIQFVFTSLASPALLRKIARGIRKGYHVTPFIPVVPPVMIRPEVFRKMARLTDADKEERYYFPKDDLYLVGSAEHSMGSMHMDETFQEKALPLRYLGFSTAFRRESGSYGKDTKGILRVHQFDKIEMESFTLAEDSRTEQDFLVAIQEYFLQALGLPYRVVAICTGDMGVPDARQIDLECWMPGQREGQGEYRETHTADLMTDYQARRLRTRVRRKDGRVEYVHMNDATAFAIPRTLIAIIENYQTEQGTVRVPKVLQKWVGTKEIVVCNE